MAMGRKGTVAGCVGTSRPMRGWQRCLMWLWLVGSAAACAPGSSSAPVVSTYDEAKRRYVAAIERDLRAGAFPHVRLVPIPPTSEPYKPGAAFKKGATKPASHACIISEQRMPEAKQLRELWAAGQQPQFTLAADASEMLAQAAPLVPAIQRAITLKQAAMVSLADTTQISLTTNDLLPVLRHESCLDATLAQEVMMVQGIIYGAEAVSNARYLDVGSREDLLQGGRLRARWDPSGGFYLQETKVRPKYWMVSAVRLDLTVEQTVKTPEQRVQALKAYVSGQGGELVVSERTPSDQEVQALSDRVAHAGAKKSGR